MIPQAHVGYEIIDSDNHCAICGPWYMRLYNIAWKPIKIKELQYTMAGF